MKLADSFAGKYTSFGAMIRINAAAGDNTALQIEKELSFNRPIPLELGWDIVKGILIEGLNFLSGYPFNDYERLQMAHERAPLGGWILLTANDEAIRSRSRERAECPLCSMPGRVGTSCQKHGVLLRERRDMSPLDVEKRRKVMRDMVIPFLRLDHVRRLPNVSIDTSELSPDEVATSATLWLRELIAKGNLS
jgi:hypothetical protein